ncbi:hypothetical protein [Marinobacter salicampi]|uniref:hypothetical protein n=1 Tax=Marinobacter salicampi TaxID=435907 RepID=UPI00140DB12E|nr:hypothetical protein [Marinobacter salicampi]
MSEKKPQERRKLRRLPAAELNLEWRLRKGLFSRFRPAEGRDFTRNGVSVVLDSSDSLNMGDAVELKVELIMEAGALSLEKAAAVVRNIRETADGQPLYGLEFDFTANRSMKSDHTRAQLGRMEGILKRSEKLQLRIQPLKDIDALRRN